MNSKQPDSLVFFVDRNLGSKVVVNALRQVGVQVEVHDDHFPQGAKDEIWLTSVGKKDWIVLTKDKRIRYREPEKIAVKNANVRVFTLSTGGLQAKEMADIFIKALPKINRFVLKHQPPFIAKVTKSGNVSMLVNY